MNVVETKYYYKKFNFYYPTDSFITKIMHSSRPSGEKRNIKIYYFPAQNSKYQFFAWTFKLNSIFSFSVQSYQVQATCNGDCANWQCSGTPHKNTWRKERLVWISKILTTPVKAGKWTSGRIFLPRYGLQNPYHDESRSRKLLTKNYLFHRPKNAEILTNIYF